MVAIDRLAGWIMTELDPRPVIGDEPEVVVTYAPLRHVRKPRRPSLLSRMKQILQAARAVGVEVTITVEGEDKLTATPVNAKKMDDPGDDEVERWIAKQKARSDAH
jgi:hypothetical protein